MFPAQAVECVVEDSCFLPAGIYAMDCGGLSACLCMKTDFLMKRLLLVMILCVLSLSVAAQSRNTVKKLFDEGRFEEVKPMVEKLFRKTPKNSEYNYWYAASCLETGDTVDVEEMLKFASSRGIVNADRYLGDYYFARMQYPLATECYEDFLENTKDDSLRVVFSRKAQLAKNAGRMVMNASKVCVVDSFVVDKENFLSVYRLSADVGVVTTNAAYFDDPMLSGYLSETERRMDIFFSDYDEYDESLTKIYHNSKVTDEWGTPRRIEGFNTYGNDDYPFMCPDGITLYFASDGEGSIGGYDIFMTRMDTETGRFLRPDNLGMPFNSTANDYMLVIDEVSNLGWFATDRNQPDGLVCVYVFVPNRGKSRYDTDKLGYDDVLPYAQLSSVAATQDDEAVMRTARQQLAMLLYADSQSGPKAEFLFIIDDIHDYTRLSDFKSTEARKLFTEWQKRTAQHAADVRSLEQQRDAYASANAAERKRMSTAILGLEAKVEADAVAVEQMENEIRRLEQEKIYK